MDKVLESHLKATKLLIKECSSFDCKDEFCKLKNEGCKYLATEQRKCNKYS